MSHSYSEIQQANLKRCNCDSVLASGPRSQITSSIGKYLISIGVWLQSSVLCVQFLVSWKIYQLILIMLLFTNVIYTLLEYDQSRKWE
jgi:hypothetical protein